MNYIYIYLAYHLYMCVFAYVRSVRYSLSHELDEARHTLEDLVDRAMHMTFVFHKIASVRDLQVRHRTVTTCASQ